MLVLQVPTIRRENWYVYALGLQNIPERLFEMQNGKFGVEKTENSGKPGQIQFQCDFKVFNNVKKKNVRKKNVWKKQKQNKNP